MPYSPQYTASRKISVPQQDEVEASSILVSLANNHQYNTKKIENANSKSMSIHNLLESGRHDPPRKIDNGRMQMSPEKYIGHNMQPKAQMTIQHNQSQFQRPPQKRDYYPVHQQNSFNRVSKQHPYNHSPPNAAIDYSKQYSRMKCNPKIRRNALQAYISYMTYTDIRRRRMGKAMHQQNTIPPASSPYNNNNNNNNNNNKNSLMESDPYASHYQQQQHQQQQLASPPYHHQHHLYHHHQPPPPPPPPPPQQHHHNQPYKFRQPHPAQQQLLSPPPPSPTQRISVQTKPTPSSSSPLDKRMPSPPASKVIVEQPLTAFLHHKPAPSHPQHYHRFNNVGLSPPISRQHYGRFR